MPAMKILVLLAVPSAAAAASWSLLSNKGLKLNVASSAKDVAGCTSHAKQFITSPVAKARAIERAMDHCALDKKVDDRNFVCPHYRDILTDAFRRKSTTEEFTAETFCNVAEAYVQQLKGAAQVPNMGEGSGREFEISKDCKPAVAASFAGSAKKLPAKSVPDFLYALCNNQDCAHFLPSRTRWCKEDHQPTHSASVCEAVRLYAQDEVSVVGGSIGLSRSDLDADEVCSIYGTFVEKTHVNVEAYQHVVHGKTTDKVPVPEDKPRALQSSQMKHEAGKHQIRDASGNPVESTAAMHSAAGLVFLAMFIHVA